MTPNKTLVLFSYDWDDIEFSKLEQKWPLLRSGFDLFSFPSNARLTWFDMERFASLAALRCRLQGATAVVSNHEQFGALSAALVAEKMGLPGTSVNAVLACQHKLYAREVLQRIAPEANIPFQRLDADYGSDIAEGLSYPSYVKPVKAAFSVLARQVDNRQTLFEHTRFSWQELWVIRHLVEPFEKICRNRLPSAGTAHSLMLEESIRGRQYCLDGYCFNGKLQRLGVVDAIMYPGTDAFMRWEYPTQLVEKRQQEAQLIAERFLSEIGFTHGFFNMEFVVEENSDQIKVIEFNPRMAAQFSDLYSRVDGVNLHAIALALAHGIDPQSLPVNDPKAACASSLVYRSFDPEATITMPSKSTVQNLKNKYADALLLPFPKSADQIKRDFKWLGSYRYGILHLEGDNPADLRQRCDQASQILGWPAPYFEQPVIFEEATVVRDDHEVDDYDGDLSSVKT